MQHPLGKQNILIRSFHTLTFLCAFVSSTTAYAQERPPGLHAFFLHYTIVSHLKERDDKRVSRLMKFREASPRASTSLAQFWWAWALRSCAGYLDTRIETISKIRDSSERERLVKQLEDDRNHCVEAFIFDRWSDINESIENKFAAFPKDN